MRLQTTHHLLPHERWFAELALERQRTHPTQTLLRLERKYGPEGNILFSAAQADMLPGALATCTGILLTPFLNGHGYLAGVALFLFVIGIPLSICGGTRAIQSIRAGQAFRSNGTFMGS